MIQFIQNNLAVIIIAAVAIIGAIVLARFGYKKEAKAILLFLVASAERKWGSGTGEIKFSSIVASLYEKLPAFARVLLGQKTVTVLIEEAVTKLKDYLSDGKTLDSAENID